MIDILTRLSLQKGKGIALCLWVLNCLMIDQPPHLLAQQNAAPISALSDSIPDPQKIHMVIRGLEQDETGGFKPFHTLWGIASYIPRKIMDGIHHASGYSVRLINNQKFIDTVEDFLFTDDRSLGWYPLIDITSSFRPRLGINVIFKQGHVETLLKANIADENKHHLETILSYRIRYGQKIWRYTLSALTTSDDDRKFYGIGATPLTDVRSHYLATSKNDHGIYLQRRKKIQFILGFRPDNLWEFFLSSYYHHRIVKNAGRSDNPMGDSFNLETLPGFQNDTKQLYNEIAVRLDSRDKNVYISRGFRIEAYLGMTYGVKTDRSRLMRAGIDLMGTIPVIQQNRVLISRLVFDTIRNIRDRVPIPFTEYPRQPSFRGVSTRRMLRTDHYSLVPSLEYQWPLTFNLSGHVFLDYLIVTDSLNRLHLQGAPWAAGFGIDFHGINAEIGRVQFAAGSEGFRFILSIGMDPMISDRINWK